MEVRPDSIVIQYQKLSSRKLSVRLRSSIELARQYMYSDTIRLSPAQVTVYGPIKTLDTMKFAYTELLVKHDLSDTLVTNIKLKPLKLVHYSRPSVNAGIYVEPFTEKKVQMQITSVNCPPNLNIRTFPANVLVTYTVGVSYFNKLTPEDIQIYLDYNDLINNTQARQTLRVKNNSLHISNVRIEPQEVEFILEQN
jgi:YbbR domain-containing protein